LRDRGYEFRSISERHSDALGPSLEAIFSNSIANRIVRVVYLSGDRKRRAVALTWIGRCVPETFDEDDYTSLGLIKVCVTELPIEDHRIVGLRRHFSDSAEALKTRFSGVLVGVEWRSDSLEWGELK
jgi:hypothetical protein